MKLNIFATIAITALLSSHGLAKESQEIKMPNGHMNITVTGSPALVDQAMSIAEQYEGQILKTEHCSLANHSISSSDTDGIQEGILMTEAHCPSKTGDVVINGIFNLDRVNPSLSIKFGDGSAQQSTRTFNLSKETGLIALINKDNASADVKSVK